MWIILRPPAQETHQRPLLTLVHLGENVSFVDFFFRGSNEQNHVDKADLKKGALAGVGMSAILWSQPSN